ncbi:hypothetical protein PROFUN_04803 [Planoprotostelium fungivorum]|uniref:WD40 repeat-containing protein SMU1 n=1 Tax=Planoprotostelium fungivorum TaxID=1890364 RepID=A0A2P6NSY1_9EUKA|nr:hypothetical protein PROFUN_04803 [Planoprotostelium fungivorum]
MLGIISDYLRQEGLFTSVMTLEDELNTKMNERHNRINQIKKMKKSILEGDWVEVERLLTREIFKNNRDFTYSVYKQIYLELLEKQEYQKAFTYLTKRLKHLGGRVDDSEEFRDLCYLLTSKSVQDSHHFKNWDGAKGNSRGLLIEKFSSLFEMEHHQHLGTSTVEGGRMLELLRQASAHQIDSSVYKPTIPPKINTINDDFRCFVLPNKILRNFEGHTAPVKCVGILDRQLPLYVSGSNDSTIKLWSHHTGECISTLRGHSDRIWDVCTSTNGQMFASASGDSTAKLWHVRADGAECFKTFQHQGDVYSVDFHPDQRHIVTAGFDKVARMYDIQTETLKKVFTGHESAITKAVCSPQGNTLVTGSKDGTIKFWDIVSGVCLRTITSHLGEVTSVSVNASGVHLLSSSKDNSNRMWDLRSGKLVKRMTGHQNTSKNFIGCNFGSNELVVTGGSEDGKIYIWDVVSAKLVQKLKGHGGIVYNAKWNQAQSILASCSADGSIKSWMYDKESPLFYESRKPPEYE